ncbi:MAG: phage major capsid protein, partial [Clostridia bacterium]|nr:phage major capsid protein [Clostridia bacterium]
MALKALMLRKKLDLKAKELEALRGQDEEFQTREAELEASIREAQSEEEQAAVDEAIEAFNSERAAHNEKITDLEKEIGELETELAAEEREQVTDPAKPEENKREVKTTMQKRFGLTEEMIQREDVQAFLGEIRSAMKEKRALSNAGLLIPEVFLGIVRENVIDYSKLYRHVFLRRIGGEGKLVVMGTIPEAVWTAVCANLNELDLSFADVTVDANKVAAFIPVCNATLEDCDIDLAAEILEALNIAIGKALDKAILYGTGSGMPLGVYARLAQTSQPGDYPATGRPWVDLHTSNMLTIANSVTGVDLFKTIMLDAAVMSGKYSRGEVVWAMNDTTYKFLRAQGMSVNAAGQIVSAVDGSMPGVGGIVEVLDFVPNYNIIGGYFDCYLLSERGGV